MKNLTPAHLRCGKINCPSIHQLEDGRLLIVGKIAVGEADIAKIEYDAFTEYPVIIDRALLAELLK